MSNIQINKPSSQGIAHTDSLGDVQALPDSKTAAEFASALAKHKQQIRTSDDILSRTNSMASTEGSQKSLGNMLVEEIKNLDTGYKSKREKLLKDIAKAGSDGNAMDVMKYTFELNQLENNAELCIKVVNKSASALDQLTKMQ